MSGESDELAGDVLMYSELSSATRLALALEVGIELLAACMRS